MHINSIALTNFRCFEDIEISFNKEFTVVVGNNGAGKSTILDAVAIALGGYLAGFRDGLSNSISRDDARFVNYSIGSREDRQQQFPVIVKSIGDFNGNPNLSWERTLNSQNGKTTTMGAQKVMKHASDLQEKVRAGSIDTILPLVSYYGTGRLWAQKKEKRNRETLQEMNRLMGYVDCLDSMANEKLMLSWFEKMTYMELQENRKIPELQAVLGVLNKCLARILSENAENVKTNVFYEVKTNNLTVTYTEKDGKVHKHPMKELSDGYKSTLGLIADIAYRMAMLNPQLLYDVVTSTPGVVLIDEIDLHLHPLWQKHIVKDLREIFPKVQFIVTTHAPHVIGSVKSENILILQENLIYLPGTTTYGRDVNSILREIMDVSVRQSEIEDEFKKFYELIDDNKIEAARKVLGDLEQKIGSDDPEITSANVTLRLESLE